MKQQSIEALENEIVTTINTLHNSAVPIEVQYSLVDIAQGKSKMGDFIEWHQDMLRTKESRKFLQMYKKVMKMRTMVKSLIGKQK